MSFLSFQNRVLAPPGGKTSISLFGNDAAPEPTAPKKEVNRCQAARNKSNVFGAPAQTTPEQTTPVHHQESQQRRQMSSVFGEANHPAPAPKAFEPDPPRKPHVVNPHQEMRQKSSLFKEPIEQSKPPPARKANDIIGGQGSSAEQSHSSIRVCAPPGGESHISFG